MKNLIHIFNVLCWMAVPNLITAVLSILFNFKYLDAVQSSPYVVVYSLYALTAICMYGASTTESDNPMAFIK